MIRRRSVIRTLPPVQITPARPLLITITALLVLVSGLIGVMIAIIILSIWPPVRRARVALPDPDDYFSFIR